MPLFALSDLHLHDDEQPYLFTERKLEIFLSVVDEVLRRDGELLLAGDVFDLTGMNPPRQGLAEFFRQVLGPHAGRLPIVRQALICREVPEQLASLQLRYPRFFKALGTLARKRKLILIPGNHDCALDSPRGLQSLAEAIEAPALSIRRMHCYARGEFLVAAHGHEGDPANRTDQGCENPGAALTGSLYRGVMPLLEILGVPPRTISAIPAVRPEEKIVEGIEYHLGPERSLIVLRALVDLLAQNGHFNGIQALPMKILARRTPVLRKVVRSFLTVDRIREVLPTDEDLREMGRAAARKLRGTHRVVVAGHTHELDFLPDYVNLGTWIDHIGGLTPEKIRAADRSLPVLRVERDGSAVLSDAEEGRVYWSYPVEGTALRSA